MSAQQCAVLIADSTAHLNFIGNNAFASACFCYNKQQTTVHGCMLLLLDSLNIVLFPAFVGCIDSISDITQQCRHLLGCRRMCYINCYTVLLSGVMMYNALHATAAAVNQANDINAACLGGAAFGVGVLGMDSMTGITAAMLLHVL
jgi:hypothetical protein